MILYTLTVIIIIIYLFLIGLLIYGFDKVNTFKLQDLPAITKFSVVIPFRNEAENLPKLLASVSRLNYPKALFEIIFVDDDSSDNSLALLKKHLNTSLKSFDIQIIKNQRVSQAPKKDAITTAIAISKYDWSLTTDADCVLPTYWLDTFDECIQTTDATSIVAPVTYRGDNSFFNRFQILDMLSLQGATLGSFGIHKPFMCNGANFAYLKSEFKSVGGFNGNTNIASGDDTFLLQKFLKNNAQKVHYLKSEKAVVTTNPAKNLTALIHQRVRWASKTRHYSQWFAKAIGIIIFLGNLVFLALIPAVIFLLIPFKSAIALFVIKFSIDFLLLFKTSRFFKQETLLLSYLFAGLLYPVFNVYIVLLSLFKSYKWKGRTFKK